LSPYTISLLLRLFFVFFGFGYLHPDSFFQSPEVVAADVFSFDTVRPWEFDPSNPCRTIFTPAMMSGIPLLFLKGLSYVVPNIINSFSLFYVPRLFLFLLSFITDYTVWTLSGQDMEALLTLSTSWIVFTFLLQSFSNTTETLLLSLFLLLVFRKKSKSSSEYILLGVLISVGVFNRFTFLFYTFPVVLYLLYEELRKEKGDWPTLVTCLFAGFSAMSVVIIFVDSVYFGSILVFVGDKQFGWLDLLCPKFYTTIFRNASSIRVESLSWTITPINSLTYNSKQENLAVHGEHLRIMHLVVNMPLLFGPLAVVALAPYYIWLDDLLGSLLGQTPKRKTGTVAAGVKRKIPKATGGSTVAGEKPKSRLLEGKFSTTKLSLLGCIVSSMLFLSLATHQEMRFLLPTLIPFVLLGYKGIFGSESNIYIKSGWIAFNILMLIIMGIMHQGGVVPSILKLPQPVGTDTTHHVVFYHTYMPPQHLFGIKRDQEGKPKFAVYDLKGGVLTELRKTIRRITESLSYSPKDKIFLVAPGTVDLENLVGNLQVKRKQWFHLTMENPPQSIEDITKLVLYLYEYVPTQKQEEIPEQIKK